MSQQNVYIDVNSIQSGGGITELTVVYSATDNEVSGLGLRIHYDSSQLSVNGISDVLSTDLTFAFEVPSDDSEDFDNEVSTDQFIDFGWASVAGDWPGSSPVNLVTISFSDANLDETSINFTSTSNAVDYDFVGQSIQLSASSGEDMPPVFTSSDNASVDENTGESQVVYTATSDASSTVIYSLIDNTVYAAETSEATAPELVSATQMVSAADVSSAQAGGQLSLTVNYSADDNQLPGLGLRIHFDSSLITLAEMTNIFAQDQIFVDAEAQADTDDYDANAATDSFVTAAWASVDGDWPNTEIPSELLTVLFDVSADASGTAAVGFSAIDTAIGYDFSAPSYDIAIMGSPLSIDATTGEVSLSDNPDFESQESYNFTVTATDASGQSIDQAVTLSVNNLDEATPVITSADSVAVDEDTGAGQVIYTATADDSADTSDGVSYSLVDTTVYTATVVNADAPADTQLVSVASYSAPDANGQIAVTVNYSADDSELPGLGLRIHYDSSVLSVADITEVLAQGLVYTNTVPEADMDDLDANASTDAYVTVGWASVDGDWPNTELPDELLTILFDVAVDASGSTAIGFSSTSTPVGYDFSGNGYDLELIESPLSIDSVTGEVTLSENPDYGVRDAYNFSVTATDAVGNASSAQAVTVTVNEASDLPPVFTSPVTASVDENIGSQQVVYTAASDSSSEIVYSLADNTVYSGSQENTNQADLLANTSMVSASGVSSAEAGEQVSLAINYNADDNQLPGLGLRIHYDSSKLTVAGVSNVLDQDLIYNDTAPQADAGDYDADASTDAYITVGWAALAGNWPDADLPSELLNVLFDVAADAVGDASVGFSSTSTPVGYEFAGEGYDIEIITSPLEIDSVTGEVTLIDNPDFESQESYNFTVIATDDSGQSIDQAVTLSVNNLDEATPVITSADSVAVDEDTGAGQVIYTATADDSADTSDGVSYSLVDTTVYTATVVNADAPADTQLVSVASYSAPDANGQIAVTVNYSADDSELPGLGLRIHYDSSVLSVADITEVLAQGLVYTNTVSEADMDDLDANASTDAYVTVGWASVDGDWPNTELPDELLTILFDVAVDASGSTAIGFSSTSTPVGYDFSGNGYDLELIESPLSIDSVTGEVTLSENPDYGVRDAYNFSVTATDAVGNASSAQAVTVTVNEASDLPPVFTSPVTASVDENIGSQQVVYTAASDSSSEIVYSLADNTVYSGSQENTNQADLLANTSMVSASGVSSAEAGEQVSLAINYNADDNQLPGLGLRIHYDSSKLTVAGVSNVLDQDLIYNDTAPQADAGDYDADASTDAYITVGWAALAGNWPDADLPSELLNVLFDVAADAVGDASVGFSSTSTPVGYEFAGEGYDIEIITSPLEIDSVTGEVTLIDNPDFESQESYNFTVIATDDSGQSIDQAVTLSVNNLDEATPVITSADSVAVDEDTGAGQVIYTATADDSADTSDGVSYSLVDTTVYTATVVNADAPADTQLVSVASYSAPDANGQIAVTVNYSADDSELPGLGLRIHYDSSVLSVADITEVLAQGLVYTNTVSEADMDDLDANASTDAYVTVGWASVDGDWPNTELPDELLTILFDVAVDASGSTAIGFSSTSTPVGYDFSGNGYDLELIESPLSIDSVTGEVTLSENPDYGVRDAYNFSVTATDAVGNASSAQAVTVTVNEVDDIPPVITSNNSVAVDENSGAGQVVYTATAEDSADTSDGFTFSLADGSDAALTIDSATGEVTLATDPDHETQSQYGFSVIATDSAGNASVAQAVTLDINNLDEVAPVVTSGDSATAVDENSAAGQVIYTVTADDTADVSDGVSYSLVDDTDYTNTNTNSQQLSDDLQMVSVSGSPVAFGGEQVEISVAYNADDNQLPGLGLRVHFDSTKLSVAQVKDVLDQDLIFVDADTQTDTGDYDADSSTDSFVTVAWASLNGNWPNEELPSDLLTVVFDVASDTSGNASIGFSAMDTAVDYELSATSYDLEVVNSPLSIDSATGEVTLVESPDFEAQDSYNFTVVATDAAGNVSDSQSVSLDVNNLDEVAPTITSDAATIVIDENSGAGQVVYTATADDSLDISNGVTFSLVESYGHMNNVSSDSALSINTETGEVTLADNPDYEAQDSYFFAVVATDAAGNTGNMQSMMIEVNNLDEVAPAITSATTATAVDENSGAGQVVYTATAEDSADTSDGFTFSLADGSDAALTIDSATGEVTLATDPDHETQSQYGFSVIATDSAGNASVAQAITLDINDLDDAAPAITSGATAVVIDENSGAGQVVYTATADDSADDVSDTPITFSLEEGSDTALSINSGTGEVTLNTDPDHETQSQYSFAVIATDAAGNQSNAQSVSLEINDLDDAAPIIISGDTAVAINENSGAGQLIYTATSNDSADNVSDTPITYSLSEDSDTALSIDPATGDVTLTNNPDHEAQSQYSFAVIATDAAGNASEAQSVTLDINDLDDAAPSITSGATAVAIDENSGAGQVVYTATADDSADDVADTPIIYSLTSDSDTGLSIDSVTGEVTLNSNPDYESQSQYSFAVIATDNAGNASNAQAVNLEINNLDDAAPTITSGATAVAINENSGAEQIIYTATADDSTDISEGITFSLAEGSDAELSIDSATGAVTLTSAPDFETQSQYSFAVIATDAAGNASAAQSVTLDINNLDEVAPTITSGDSAAVLESSGADALVYRAIANDSADVSAGVTFSLSADSDVALSIDPVTGEVTLADEPDFVAKPSYSFTVIADDGVNQSQKTVSLSVVDEDLEAPVFTSSATVAIDENIGENQVIYTAITNDESLVNYSLSEDSDAELSIDSASGAVTLATDPDSEAQSEYNFTVIATDIANNVSQQAVTVSINDLDDAAPTVTSGAVADAIDENSGAGQVVYTVTADDSGDDVTATPIIYSLTEDSDAGLSIDALTGAVSLTADPDHESQSAYSFALVATDAAGNASEAQSVTLNINDLDDAAPTITSGALASIIDENTGAGQVIYTATADDSADISDGYSFSLAEGSDAGLTIDASSGAVSLIADPDHETQAQYSFAVIATDTAGNSSAAQAVILNINDLDDAAPTITSADTADAIDENSGAGQVIYSASSNDSADDVVKGPISYSLAEGSDAGLSIDSQSGLVTLISDPDHESQIEYNFSVIATDGAGNASEPKSVSLNINDLDDAAPTMTSGASATAIDENSGAEQVIYTATADDSADVSEGVTFSLADDSDSALSIDASSGEVTLASDPDHEVQSQYSFSVIATDAAGNQSATQAVTLDINDVDDANPVLTSSDTATAIDENSGAGQVVYTATADDSADISGGVSFSLASNTTYGDAPELAENTQHVYVSESTLSNDGTQVSVVVSYNSLVSDTTGLGLRVHFNSNELSFNAQSDVLDTDFIFSADAAVADDADYDTNSSTDTYLDAGWASVDGNWPNEGMPTDLMTLTFDINPGASSQTAIGVSSSESPVGVDFEGQMYDLALESGSMSAGSAFSIDSETGEVTLIADPDFESASEYSFSVMATDAAGNTSELQDLTLAINNLDEIAPVITSADSVAAIDENSGAGQIIYTATANDSADVSGGVTFSLSEASDAALSIDSASGAVTLTNDSDYEVQTQYNFVVVATDAAGNQSDAQSVTLNINNTDDTAPVITSADTAAAIDENTGAGQVVYTAIADDSSDVSNGVTFSLSDDSDSALSIDASSGEVTLASDPDHETQSQFSFSVIATDAAGNQSAPQAVTLQINDLDEVAPQITSGIGSSLDENSGAGQVVYTATSDDSADVSGGVTYGFVETNSNNDSGDGFLVSEVTIPEMLAATQQVYVSSSTKSEDGTKETVVISYMADNTDLPGLGLRVHFDSTQLSFVEHSAVYASNAYVVGPDNSADSQDFDQDDITDSYINIGWASADGNWPGSVPVELATLTFDISNASGSSEINFSASSVAVDYVLDAPSHEIVISSESDNPTTLLDNTQHLYVSESSLSENGSETSVVVSYNALQQDTTGLGLRIHFDSDILSLSSLSDVLNADIIFANDEATADTQDYDNNSATDMFVDIGWASIYSNWPNEPLPADLLTLNFDILDAGAETTSLGLSEIESPVGFNFDGQSYNLDLSQSVGQGATNSSQLSINSETGEVTLATNPDYESQAEYSFSVVATDTNGNQSDVQAVTVSVNNLDEISPSITSDDLALAIDENSGANQIVYVATADDSADISKGVSFSLTNDSDVALSIDAVSGEVTLSSNPDYELQNQYSFTVVADDGVNAPIEQSITLDINNLDESAPSFTSGDTALAIDENTGANQTVYLASTDDSADISSGVTYSLLESGSSEDQGSSESIVSIPSVQASTQHVYVSSSEKSEDGSQETVVITYSADDSTLTGLGVKVHFDSSKLSLAEITDLLQTGKVTTPTIDSVADDANDEDGNASTDKVLTMAWSNPFGGNWPGAVPTDLITLTYDLVEGATGNAAIGFSATSTASGYTFDGQAHEVVVATNAAISPFSINPISGEVTLVTNPDYEMQSQYSFTVVASDGVNANAQQLVSLEINNLDEIAPVITSGSAVASIDENTSAGQHIYTATADDSQDTSAGITFSLSSDSDSTLDIHPTSGEVTLNEIPDFESQEQYNFSVIASDGINQSVEQPLVLSINDIDDTAPVITSADQIFVDENIAADGIVYTVTTDDAEAVAYELISVLQIDEGAIDQRFVENVDGSITMQLYIDDSLVSNYAGGITNYDLLITFNDQEISNPLVSIQNFNVNLVNDSTDGEIRVSSIIFPGSVDITQNPLLELTYQLESGFNSAEFGITGVSIDSGPYLTDSLVRYYGTEGFRIDSATGEVSIIESPDHELQASYNFTVSATDLVGNKSEPLTVDVTINDLDDSAPTIVSSQSISAIDENTGAGQVIYTANADDSGDISDGVTYSLTGDSDSALEIDSITGQVTLLDNPDYETQSSYNLTVVATDGAGNVSDGLPLSIAVNNLDDTAPEIISAETADAIDENSGAAQVIYTAIAEDSLDVESVSIVFSLTDNSDSELTIDAITGEVTLSDDANYEAKSQYSFAVVATDAAGNASEAQSVTLDINNLDEVAATITSSDSVTINENSGSDQVVYTATADDSADISEGVIFSLAEESDSALSIDAVTGEVTLADNPDYEEQSSYSITVIATDLAGNTSQQVVNVAINNLDEVAPSITSGSLADSVDENSSAGQFVYSATADDSLDISGGVTFSLTDEALGFSIDENGIVITNSDFSANYEDATSQSFTVVATDATGNSSEQVVSVSINNLDEVAPTITSGDVAEAINENSGADQVVYIATAIDGADVSDGISFSLANESLGFSIDADTGAVTTNSDFVADFESSETQSFTVIAIDAAGNSSEQVVTIVVNNLDEVAPNITSGDSANSIDENSGEDQVIYTATADDSGDVSGGVTFSLSEDSDTALSIDVETGAVTLSGDPDYEAQAQYNFTVVVTDAADNVSEQAVTLEINNLDEVAPTITSSDTAGTIDENKGAGQVVYTAIADDSQDISESITFSLGEGSDTALSIDSETGEVSLSTDPDYETQSEYQFSVIATDAAGNQSAAQSATLTIDDVDDSSVSGVIYHWGTQTVMDNVSVTMHSQSNSEVMSSLTTDVTGTFAMNDLPSGDVTLTVEADAPVAQYFPLVSSADVLAALKMAVGMNPNATVDGQQNSVSPYQFIAADVNKDGRVSSYDALAILRMSVGMPDAISQEWMFVEESTDFWNEDAAEGDNKFNINKASVDWDSDPTEMTLTHPAEMNYVGVILGDVNNSWSDSNATRLPQSHLNNLESDGIAPLEQWNLSPDADLEPPTLAQTIAASVLENSGSEQIIYTASSFDGSATFRLTADSDPALSIDALSGDVILNVNPDFEAQQQYHFGVVASDAAGNDSAALELTLQVTNVDDAVPSITSGNTATAIDENSGIGQIIYQATVDDSADISDGVTFSLAAGSDSALAINVSSGEVTLADDPDNETKSQYSFTVVATDSAGNATDQLVTLDINDLDDSAPVFTSPSSASVLESSDANVTVYQAIVDDSADINNGTINFSLSGDDATSFAIDASGLVTLLDDPESSVQASYSFVVVAIDGAGNASQQSVTLTVVDQDLEGPVFTSAASVAIDENVGDAQVVYTATSQDESSVTYSLAEGSDLALSIDVNSGAVTLNNNPDFEAQSQYSFTVVATDAAGNSSEQAVSVAINDLDEIAPTITSGDTAVAIDENSGAGQLIYTASADDSADVSGGITYTLEDTTQYVSFPESVISIPTIQASTQHVYVSSSEKSEDGSQETVVITYSANDNTLTGLGVRIHFDSSKLTLTDISDILGGSLSDPTIGSVASDDSNHDSNASTDKYLTLAYADPFSGNWPNQGLPLDLITLTYDLVEGATGNAAIGFSATSTASGYTLDAQVHNVALTGESTSVESQLSINSATGEVMLLGNTDYEALSQYNFTVIADDGVNNAVEQSVTLDINNLDEIAPTITSGDTAVAIDENSGAGQLIYTAVADDSQDISAGVTFSLSGADAAAFTINETSGEVKLIANPNADIGEHSGDDTGKNQYSFTVIADDGVNTPVEKAVTLDINNLDEIAPTITSGDTAAAIDENSGAGQLIYSAVADDTQDISAGVTFSLAGADAAAFSINAGLGEVTLTANPNFESQSQYNFIVVADDGVNEAVEKAVSLDINNLDEVAPTIISASEVIAVNLGQANPVIYTAEADDTADISGGITFTLEDTTVYASVSSGPAVSEINIPTIEASTQHVYVSSSEKSEDGSQETVVITYSANDNTLTGLGVRIHFDSSKLTLTDISDILGGSLSDPTIGSVASDDSNHDSNASTDKYLTLAYADPFSGNWPNQGLPLDLITLTYDLVEGATGNAAIGFSATSTASGYTLDAQVHNVALTADAAPVESKLSIDSVTGEVAINGELDPALQSEYSFTITAEDTAGNSSDLAVVVDAEQPMIDAAMVVVVDGDTPSAPIYQASANIENVSYQITDLTQYPNTDGNPQSVVSVPTIQASTQHVYVSSSEKSEDGSQETVVITYSANDNTLTGLGVRIHFDSSKLTLTDISDILGGSLSDPTIGSVASDDSNHDSNASTDKYLTLAYADPFSGNWPNQGLPLDLITLTYDLVEGATGNAAIGFSATSTASGYTFDGQSHGVVLAADASEPAAELVIDNAAGTVSLDATVNTVVDYSFRVEGTDADGDAIGSQTVPVVVVDQIVNADASSYTGTADEDVFALADGSAEITSGAGEDEFILDPAFASATHTITDFESGVDTIHISEALLAAGYNTSDNAPTQLASAEMSADILDLVNGDDSSLDNLFGATYDEDSNTLTVFADSDSSAGSTDMDSFQITLDDSATVEDDDIVANLSPFIA